MLYKIGVFVLGGTLIFIVALINSKKALTYLDRKFEERAEWLVKELDTLFIEFNKRTALIVIYASTLGVGFLVFVLFLPHFIGGIIIGTAVGFMISRAPIPVIGWMKAKRSMTFNLQMVDALTLMSNGLRSGLNLIQAVGLVVEEMPDPIKQMKPLLTLQDDLILRTLICSPQRY